MTSKSWEIIVAGLVFIGISVYLINHEPDTSPTQASAPRADSLRIQIMDSNVKVIALENLKNLENLRNLENLKNLENLEELSNLKNLEKLKALANYMPVEVKDDYIKEIDRAMKELDQELVNVQVDINKGLISIEEMKNLNPGSWNVISPGVYAFVKEFDASELENTSLEIPFGSITVMGTDAEDAKLVIQASGKINSEAYLKDKLNATIGIDANQANFAIRSNSNREVENLHLQATLNIPADIAVSMKTLGGHINSTNIHGNQMYSTNGGHITLKKLTGNVLAKTGGGHIYINDSQANVDARTSGGHIKVSNTTGKFTMHTGGGNIIAERIQGAIQAITNGGNVELELSKLTGPLEAKTGAGTVMITLPANINADLTATGNTINFDSAFSFTGSKSAGKMDGKIGSGGTAILANTDYGKVVIKSN